MTFSWKANYIHVKITPTTSSDKMRIFYTHEWGKRKGERLISCFTIHANQQKII